MIALDVGAVTGHYRIPGQVSQGAVAATYSVVTPSQGRGFLNSFGGIGPPLQGRFAYGQVRDPSGFASVVRQVHVWGGTGMRINLVESWFDVAYVFLVDGPAEERIRAALRGEVDAFGVLYLGTSDDIVHWIGECKDPLDGVEWVVPGTQLTLPVVSGRGYNNMGFRAETFDLQVGQPHWMDLDTK